MDIISHKDDTFYFVEVKYRKNGLQGGGLAAITQKKIKQMRFAAEYYATRHRLGGKNLRLVAVSVTGDDFHIEDFLEIE